MWYAALRYWLSSLSMVSNIEHFFISLFNIFIFLFYMSVLVFCPVSNWVIHDFIVKLREFFISFLCQKCDLQICFPDLNFLMGFLTDKSF